MNTTLPISNIIVDAGLQVRAGLSLDVVKNFTEAMRRGEEFPPVDVFRQGELLRLADGFHRLEAARRAGRTTIDAEIHDGDQRAAFLFALEANAKHGRPLPKRRAIALLLSDPEWSEWNNVELARRCGASESYVRKVREELSSHKCDDGRGRLTRRGKKTYRMKRKKAAGKPEQSPPPAGPNEPSDRPCPGPTGRPAEAAPPAVEMPTQPPARPDAPPRFQSAFDVIVLSPPWGEMSHEDIGRLPVPQLARDDAVLWLWADNAHVPQAVDALRAWGFQYRTLLPWVKYTGTAGELLLDRTEQCLLAVRGEPVLRPSDKTYILYQKGVSSRQELTDFYALVEAMCAGNKAELFARKPRQGWVMLGDGKGGFSLKEVAPPNDAAAA
jgi:N6-adenosine-specific RNA methylase IME4